MKPILVKFGVAFVFSLAGIFVVRLRRKGTKPSLPPPSPVFSGLSFQLVIIFSCLRIWLFLYMYQ